jgi:prevent-host-death family protein
MREIGAFEAKNKLSELLTAVEHGEEIVITRRGRPVARLVKHDPEAARERARAAAERIREIRKELTLGEGITVVDLIKEGRKR